MPSRDEQLKANCLRGWKMPWCTDCEGFIWYFITPEISTATLSPNKIAQQQREWTIIQNIHYYYSLQKCSSGNPIKRHKYIKCKNSVYIFTLYTINLRCYPWHPLPFPTVFSIYIFFSYFCIFYTGCPLFKRSSLKRSFLSRSWITASFDPWISSSEAILAVLPVFLGNPLQNSTDKFMNFPETIGSHELLDKILPLVRNMSLYLWN